MLASFRDSQALTWNPNTCRFELVQFHNLSWSIQDVGALYGAILVERFRTYGGKLIDLVDRFERIQRGAQLFRMNVPFDMAGLEGLCQTLLHANRELVDQACDVSIVVLLSPGEADLGDEQYGLRPTCKIHVSPLPYRKLAHWYRLGTPLVYGGYRTVPSQCWPTQVKSRSRLPYALSQLDRDEKNPYSLELLRTVRGTVADTSVANILIVTPSGQIVSPERDEILFGCTLQAIERLVKQSGQFIEFSAISQADIEQADEIILTGSSGGIWWASSIENRSIHHGQMGPVAQQLIRQWSDYVGLDFVQQALSQGSK
ncbi:MAG: aminotransferase class IV [Pirellula sp.]